MASPRWRRASPEREDRQRPQQPLNRSLLTTRLTMTRRNPAWRAHGEPQPHDYDPAEAESARMQGSNPLRREAQATRRIFAPGGCSYAPSGDLRRCACLPPRTPVTLRTRDPRSRCLCRSSLPLLVSVWQLCVLYVCSIVMIVYTAAQSHYPRGKESGPCRLGRPRAGKGPRWAAQASP